jgi:predicted transcriptional regulator
LILCCRTNASHLDFLAAFLYVSDFIETYKNIDFQNRNMNKKEIVYRAIACDYIEGKNRFTQLELAKRLGISISTVNSAIKSLSDINAVSVSVRSFRVSAVDRLLFYWASHRNLEKDIVYKTRVDETVKEIESELPNNIAFTAYTAYKLYYHDAPADYSEVYAYAGEETLSEIKARFEINGSNPNLFVLATDKYLEKQIAGKKIMHSSVCPAETFVDLWNIRTWYAKEFSDAILKRLGV